MGLFSKLFGKDGQEVEDALGKLKNLFEEAGINTDKPQTKPEPEETQKTEPEDTQTPAAEVQYGPAGQSWGELMPAEENQYSYNGGYMAYFSDIFAKDFPEYQVTREKCGYSVKGFMYTFTKDGAKKLVVEVLSDHSASKKVRKDCEKCGIPYLRFYYDHEGWWNTRSYVTGRVKEALLF